MSIEDIEKIRDEECSDRPAFKDRVPAAARLRITDRTDMERGSDE